MILWNKWYLIWKTEYSVIRISNEIGTSKIRDCIRLECLQFNIYGQTCKGFYLLLGKLDWFHISKNYNLNKKLPTLLWMTLSWCLNPIPPGGLFDPLYHELVCLSYRAKTRFTKIHDFVPFGICQDPVKPGADDFLRKLDFQKFFLQYCKWKKNSNVFFSKIFLYNPPNSYPTLISNTKNENYKEVL